MSILSPAGDPASDKKLWWRCVFIAAAVQLVMILLFFLFESRFFGEVLLVLYYPFIALVFDAVWQSIEQADIFIPFFFWALLAACLLRDLLLRSRLDLLFRVLAERERFLEKRLREDKKVK